MYYETGIELLEGDTDVLILYGEIGQGKTTTGIGILEYFESRDWHTEVVYNVERFNSKDLLKYDSSTIIMIDNLFGKIFPDDLNKEHYNNLLHEIYSVKNSSSKSFKVIITINRNIYKTYLNEKGNHPLFNDSVNAINFDTGHFEEDEKKQFVQNYILGICTKDKCDSVISAMKGSRHVGNTLLAGFLSGNNVDVDFECDAQNVFDKYIENLRNSEHKEESMQIHTLLILAMNGVDDVKENVVKAVREHSGISALTTKGVTAVATHLHKSGVVSKSGDAFVLENDALFLCVMRSFLKDKTSRNIVLSHCSLPVLLQLVQIEEYTFTGDDMKKNDIERSNTDDNHTKKSSKQDKKKRKDDENNKRLKQDVQLPATTESKGRVQHLLIEEDTNEVEKQKMYIDLEKRLYADGKANLFTSHKVGIRFACLLSDHETRFSEQFKNMKSKFGRKKIDLSERRNLVAKMIKYHPYLEDYYQRHSSELYHTLDRTLMKRNPDKNYFTCTCYP